MKQVQPVFEEDQVELLRRKDEQTLKKIYKQNYPVITNMVVNNGGSLAEAKDVYQEAVIILYEKLQDETFELNCRIKTFLYSVSRNIWLKELKAKTRFAGSITDNEEYLELNWEEVNQVEDQYQAMNNAMQSLGEPCSTILQDFYINKSSMEIITEKFGYTNTDNAKNQKYKCLKRLKKLFFIHYNNNEKIQE
ncbi:MAG: sigma-70 family RNA polymerase sigma factor [Bacteroidota bacterium]